LGFETAAATAQRPPLYVCNLCLELHVPLSLRPAELSSAHGHLDPLFFSSGIICHRHPDQAIRSNNFGAMERACQAYHDLFGDMYDPGADVSRWNLEREAFQAKYCAELKKRCCIEVECHFYYLGDSGLYVHESCPLGHHCHPLYYAWCRRFFPGPISKYGSWFP
jgi:hypothetical protein